MIFIQNKYTIWYNSIISNAQTRTLPKDTYIERHHIIPRSLGGNNEQSNLVKLTAREHFVCHLLLTKMTIGRMRYKMSKALTMIMSIRRVGDRTNYAITSRWYDHARILASVVRKDYWTDERRAAQSVRTTTYFATVDKSTDEYKRRGEGARQYNLNKIWTEKAISSRLENCLKNAAARKGKKNQPFFRVVVIDKRRTASGGRAVEDLGYVDPLTKKRNFKKDRILYWISKGAQPSDTVHNLLITEKIIEGKKIGVVKAVKKVEEIKAETPAPAVEATKSEVKEEIKAEEVKPEVDASQPF
jgi:small subunit ribosomal protein S16